MHTEQFRQAFWGSLHDLRTTDMVRRPAFLRGNRPWRTAKVPAQATPSRNEDPNAEPRVPARARLGRKRSAPSHPPEAKGSADYDLVSDGESNMYPDIIPEAEAGANTTAITEDQATVPAEQSQIREQEAEASEPTSDSSTDNSSSSSDSDSDTDDNRSDRTTCYKRRPRGRTTDTPTAGTVAADGEPAQPISEADHTGVPDTCDNMLLRDAIKQLTQEMVTMRQEWKTVSETQQGLVQELKETNKQLQEVNEYYRYLLELEHRKQVATTGLMEQCRTAAQKKRIQKQGASSGQARPSAQ